LDIIAAMGRHMRRIVFSSLGSEVIPAFARTVILRQLGAEIDPTACIWSGCHIRSHQLVLRKNVFINVGFFFDGTETLRVGNNVRMGQFVSVITATHRIGPPEQRCEITPIYGDVTIEDGCWIGARATLMPGVTVRRGCVIASGATVFFDTEPNGLYGGTPARRLKELPC